MKKNSWHVISNFPPKRVFLFFLMCVSKIKFIPIQHKSVIVHVCFVLFIVCLYKYKHSGRLAELECNGALSARLQEHFGGNWVMPCYSRRPNHPTSIPVREFEIKPKNRDFVVYHKGLFLVGNVTRNQPTRHRNC